MKMEEHAVHAQILMAVQDALLVINAKNAKEDIL